MGNSINKIYNKAMDYYQNGEIDKALEKCEEGISESLKSGNILNLKGLLLYIKGDIDGALTVWKINKDYNDDEIAKVYIRDAKNDNIKLNLYEWAQVDIKDLRIDEAIDKLNQCAVSEFNSINVNTALALCYLRKGNCIMANEYITKAYSVDKNNKMVNNVKAQIDNFYDDPKDEFIKKIIKYISIPVIVVAVIAIGITVNKHQSKSDKNGTEIVNNKSESNKVTDEAAKDKTTEPVKEEQENIDSAEEIKENKDIFTSAEEIQDAYIEGTDYYDNNEYEEAIAVLKPAYESKVESYLKGHILYLLATSYEKSGKVDESLKYYEEYVEKYEDSSYIKEVYYNLAILFKDKNNSKSKKYAQIIADEFSNTIYYNDKIKNILE